MVFKSFLVALFLTLPWLIGAAPGPTVQLGAWLAGAGALVVALASFQGRAWRWSLAIAALLSAVIASLQFAGLAADLAPLVSESASGELVANLRQRNQFATLMAMGGLAVWLQVRRPSRDVAMNDRFEPRLARSFSKAVAIAFLAFITALSGSRTGLLQWLVLLGLAVCWRHSWSGNLKGPLGAALLGFGLGALAGPWLAQMAGHVNAGVVERLATGLMPSASAAGFSRLALWSNVLELIAQEPLLGHGWRSLAYAHYAQDFSGTRFMEMPDNAHNLPLHLAVELGLPIATAFCGFVVWLIWKNKPWAETQADRQLAWGVLLMIGIHSLLEYPLWYGPFFMTALICVGVLSKELWRNWLVALTDTAQSAIILGVRAAAVMLLIGTVFVAFDYHRVSQIYLQPEQRSGWYAADPLAAAKRSVLFQPQAKFAELQITPLSKETAPRVLELSAELVRWSPEPRIIEKLIESSVMMGLDDLAAFHLKRYRAAYPAAHALFIKPTSAP